MTSLQTLWSALVESMAMPINLQALALVSVLEDRHNIVMHGGKD